VIWNWDKIRNKETPQYDTKQAGELAPRLTAIKSYKKIDEYTVESHVQGVWLHWSILCAEGASYHA
jgi:peptide/nickel transport system substrate-binding protein